MIKDTKTVITAVVPKEDTPQQSNDACLVVIYGMDLGKKVNLSQTVTVIGRSAGSDFQIDQEAVSRSHCRISSDGRSYVIRDLGSTNGTYVNDELIKEYVVRDGDLIKIGRCIFKFLTGDNIESSYHDEIYKLTTIDGLTQVYNKRYFVETLEREMGRAQRYKRELVLIMFDIDHFKKINDTYGHLAGDSVLKELAGTVKDHTRREDMLSRYGGEEFAIVLPELDLSNAKIFAEKIRGLVESTPFKFEDTIISVTISLGVALLPKELSSRESDQFIKIADQNLYKAKKQGRNRVIG